MGAHGARPKQLRGVMARCRRPPLHVVVVAGVGSAQNVAHPLVHGAVVVRDGHGFQPVVERGRQREGKALREVLRVSVLFLGDSGVGEQRYGEGGAGDRRRKLRLSVCDGAVRAA